MKQAFAVVIGQCSKPLQDQMENHANWQQINKESDVIELLKLILESMVQKQTRKHHMQTKYKALIRLTNFRQGQNMSTSDFLTRFKEIVLVAERLGNKVGEDDEVIEEILEDIAEDPDNPTEDEMYKATETCKQRFYAVMF